MRTLIWSLLLATGILLGVFHHHAAALLGPCQAVEEFCNQEDKQARAILLCGAELFAQMLQKPSYSDCLRTWLDLHEIDSPTLDDAINQLGD